MINPLLCFQGNSGCLRNVDREMLTLLSKNMGLKGLILGGVNVDQTFSGTEHQLSHGTNEGITIYLKGCGEH